MENTLPTAVITVKDCIFYNGLKNKFDRLHPTDFFVHINIQTHMVPIPEILDIYIAVSYTHLDVYKRQGLAGAVYTQLSDVEEETNGLYTYDRKVCKVERK